jgi:hypothetical protein
MVQSSSVVVRKNTAVSSWCDLVVQPLRIKINIDLYKSMIL